MEEREIAIDARAEYTIARINLETIASLREHLNKIEAGIEEYQHRLCRLAGEEIQPYDIEQKEFLEKLPIKAVDPFGILQSEALFFPERHFPQYFPKAEQEEEEGGQKKFQGLSIIEDTEKDQAD